ncbi:MAG: UDP-N-acetylmuramoyl-L-alanine--D-glutamate ligase [Elusimicrobia bacterium]|nr:UDP-N-acetylmuramoyl-L-alanine--D-glutamate ligase [Elusimicrobiota bacterium]
MIFSAEKFKGRKACVLGLGKSGSACANLLALKGFDVLISDSAVKPPPMEVAGSVEIERGGHTDKILDCGFAVKSPGIPPNSQAIEKLKGAGIPLFSELEVALSFCKGCKIFAVTGTNGKTTTTAMLGAILKEAVKKTGATAHICGNIGVPVSQVAVAVKNGDLLAVEISSYQLLDSSHFYTDVCAVLNLTPDHLAVHGSMEEYARAKAKIFAGQGKDNYCVFNGQSGDCVKISKDCPSKVLFFSLEPSDVSNSRFENEEIVFKLEGKTFHIKPPKLFGSHNIENAMAAGLMALSQNISEADIARAFENFKAVEHRIEEVGSVKGVRCINDSKATNVDSTLVALNALCRDKKNIWLVLGGLHKGSSYAPLIPKIRQCVKTILAIGQASEIIKKDLEGSAPLIQCHTLDNAVKECLKNAQAGDMLLLSPACASFDQFENFEHRGKHFKSLIEKERG